MSLKSDKFTDLDMVTYSTRRGLSTRGGGVHAVFDWHYREGYNNVRKVIVKGVTLCPSATVTSSIAERTAHTESRT